MVIPRAKAARLLFQLPRTCRTYKLFDSSTEWGYEEIFLNKINHSLELLIWQNATPHEPAKRIQHNANKPKLFVPEFMDKYKEKEGIAKDTEARDVDEIKRILALPRG